MSRNKRIAGFAVALALALVGLDLFYPVRHDLKDFRPERVAHLETWMWRAYYDKAPFALFRHLTRFHRDMGMPWIRAGYASFLAARAAFVFKKGKGRQDYERALPALHDYYTVLKHLGGLAASPRAIATKELEWWIVHREVASQSPERLSEAIAEATGEFYGVTPKLLSVYATKRAQAMLLRDVAARPGPVSEAQWREIEGLLVESFTALHAALH